MEKKSNACKISAIKVGGERQLGRPRNSWNSNIVMYLRKIYYKCGWESVALLISWGPGMSDNKGRL
jgi:hypothetical protein